MMKKIMSMALMLCMLLTVLPAGAYAAETDGGYEVINSGVETILPQEGALPESEELLDAYAQMAMYPEYAMVQYAAAGKQRLDDKQLVVYNALKEKISAIATGGAVSLLKLDWEPGSSPLAWPYTELGVDGQDNAEAVVKAVREKLRIGDIHDYLLMDMPFELYWYDKTQGMRSDFTIARSADGTGVVVVGMNFAFSVIEAYRADGSGKTVTLGGDSGQSVECYAVNAEKIQAANTAAQQAAQIVERYRELDDYSKLEAYKNEICNLTDYNYEVSSLSAEELEYGDPWQLVSVFDNDPNTKVVCEGYAKAFQYLCDGSEFLDENTVCYTVIGVLNGSEVSENGINHMWNIVRLGGKNYLVDVTNSDNGAIGKDGQLFMAGTTGDVSVGYHFPVGSGTADYRYAEGQMELLGGVLKLSSESYGAEPVPSPECEHIYGAWTANEDSSTHSRVCTGEGCGETESGNHNFGEDNTCDDCGYEKAEEPMPVPSPECEHIYGAWTANEDGSTHSRVCENCGVTESGNHNFGDDNFCDDCGYEKTEEPEPVPSPGHEHSYGDWTANGDGSTHSRVCTGEDCGVTESGEHQFTDGKCTICGYVKAEEPEHKHQWSEDWNRDETHHWHECAAAGCNISDNSQKGGYEAHRWDGGKMTKAASTTETGTMSYTCTVCGAVKTEEVPVLPPPEHSHQWSAVWSGTSEYHWHECEISGCGISDNSQKNSYGPHNWDAGTVTKAATTKEAGIKTYTCQTCKLTRTEQLPVLPTPAHTHSWSSKWQYSTTHHWNECTAANCPLTNNADKYGYAAHSFGAWRTLTAATATKDGSMERKCVCGYRETRSIPASGSVEPGHQHSWGSWKFTAPNYWERVCGSCGSRDIKIAEVTKPKITAGANAVWRQGSSGGLSFTSNAPLSEFVSVTLNGFTLPESYYSKAEGSTVITLNKSCLDQLGKGTHTLSINSAGGSAETRFAVKASAQQIGQRPNYNSSSSPWAAPKTGDSANMGLWIGMIVVSVLVIGAAAVYVYIIKKKK